MTQITLTITDPKEASLLKKLLEKFNSVSISTPARKRKSSYVRACEDIEEGRITYCDSVEDMFNKLN